MRDAELHLIGFASGIAGVDIRCGDGPKQMQQSSYLKALHDQGIKPIWDHMVNVKPEPGQRKDEAVRTPCLELAEVVSAHVSANKPFTVIGGDHTCAIGTWSGVQNALSEKGDMGLIWIDAHMDAHTPETTESGRLHGMPVASLLGHGYPTLTGILNHRPKIKPENIALIGVRSFESGEQKLLERLNVKIFMMDEVKERGLKAVMHQAIDIATHQTVGYGISLDLDSIDPKDAPAVDVPEENGISAIEMLAVCKTVMQDPKLIAMEIAEFDPSQDIDHKTEKLIADLLALRANV